MSGFCRSGHHRANDVTVYKEISCPNDASLLQLNLSNIVELAKKWLLRSNPQKCDGMVTSNKRSPTLPAYHLGSSTISHHLVGCDLGVLIDYKLNWNEHCRRVSVKATQLLHFLHHSPFNSSTLIECTDYVCPMLEYARPVWRPHTTQNINILEFVQRRATRWVSNSKWNAAPYCLSK